MALRWTVKGKKMSKSIGNVIVPNDVMKQLGADILRLWVASVDYQADHRVSDKILKQVSEVYRKIRNTFRFLLGNLHDFDPAVHRVSEVELEGVHAFLIVKLHRLIDKVKAAYEDYQFSTVYNLIHNFCTIELSSFYMDISKDTLYIEHADHPERRAFQTVMHEMLVSLTKLLSPILPHTADEVWEHIPGVNEESVQLTDMPESKTLSGTDELEQTWTRLMEIRDDVLKALEEARNEKKIGKSLTAALTLFADEDVLSLLQTTPSLEKLFIVSKVEIGGTLKEAPEDAVAFGSLAVLVTKAEGKTCARSWVVSPDVGKDPEYPDLTPYNAEIVRKYYT